VALLPGAARGGSEWSCRPWQHSISGSKVNTLNEKRIDVMQSTIFKLFCQIKGTVANTVEPRLCDIQVTGRFCRITEGVAQLSMPKKTISSESVYKYL
jgi:hypothetical protein